MISEISLSVSCFCFPVFPASWTANTVCGADIVFTIEDSSFHPVSSHFLFISSIYRLSLETLGNKMYIPLLPFSDTFFIVSIPFSSLAGILTSTC